MTRPEPANAEIISHVNLRAYASASTPLPWPLVDFCEYLTSQNAGLGEFLQASVSSIRLCRAQTHEYVILEVDGSHIPYLETTIWLRCERRPVLVPITSLPFHHPRAADTVALSFHKTKLTLDMQLRSMGTRGLRLIHVVRLWQIIEEKSCAYGLFSLNCWWFASVVWENLTQLFPGELPVATHDPLLKRVIKSVGPDTSRETEAVTRHFLAKLKLEFKLETTFLESVDHSPSRKWYAPWSARRPSKSSTLPYPTPHPPTLPLLPFETEIRVGSIPTEPNPWRLQLEHMLRSNEPTDKVIFLVTYRAFASGSDLLGALKDIAARDADLMFRAQLVARLWSDEGLRDRNVQASVREWIHRQHLDIQDHLFKESVYRLCPSLAQRSNGQNASTMLSTSGQDQNFITKKLRSRDKGVMKRLVEALRRREMEMRQRLTPRNTIEWLEWMFSPGARSWGLPLRFELFNTSEVYNWVLNTILCWDFEDRKNWYRCFLKLAELCQTDGNYASMCAIMQALNYVGCLKSTQKASSGNAGRDFSLLFEESLQHIREAPKDLNTGEYLYPLDPLRDDLRDSFIAASPDTEGKVSWPACQQLFLKLPGIIHPTSDLRPPNSTDAYAFLATQIEEGLGKRNSMAERTQRLAAVDKRQYDTWREDEVF